MKTERRRLIAVLLAGAMLVTACGGESDPEATVAPDTTAAPEPADQTEPTAAPETAGSLADCPNPLVIQTDWFPEPEHGALYQLTAGVGETDSENGRFIGPLAADPSLTIEIRSGGPYIGFQTGTALMYTDDDIFLGYVNTDEQIALYADQPTIAVVAPLEKNPQILMFDPATYQFETFSDIGASGAVVRVFPGQYYTEYMAGTGQIPIENFDGSYDGSAAQFVAENGAIVQQGFATQEPWNYEHIIEEWGRPVDFLMIHDSGYEIYSQVLAIRPDKLDEAARSCLSAFVPVVQQAAVDFMNDPAPVNAAILEEVENLASFWVLDAEGVVATVEAMDSLGIVANGPDSTLGNFDLDRIQTLIDQLAGIEAFGIADSGVTAADIVTNEFIDESIGR